MDSYIKPLLNRVIQSERLGVSSSVVEFTSVSSHFGEEPEDRFELKIPYAGHNLTWNILFDSQYPEVGPDFIFDEGTFLTDPDVDDLTNYVPSLRTWNPHDTNALLNVLKELLEYYKHHQIELCIKQGKRLEAEYTRLISDTEICKEDVEMILLPYGNKPSEAKFLIRIKVDSSRLPLRENLSQNDRAMLLITFRSPDWNYVTSQVYLSKSLEEVLGGPNDLHIPPFLSYKSMKDYVPAVQKLIAKKIDCLVRSHEKKKDFISTLLLLLRGSIAEYDAIEFSYITLLLEHQDFYFFVHIHLDKGFPQSKPSVVLRSVYSLPIPGKVYFENFRSFPWQCNWDAETMITNLISRIMHEVPKFQSNSMKQNQFG